MDTSSRRTSCDRSAPWTFPGRESRGASAGRNRQYCDKSAIPVKCNAVEQVSNEIRVRYTDAAVNAIIEGIGEATSPLGRHFSQNEDFFLQLEGEYSVPHIPIHHDVRVPRPSQEYLSILMGVVEQVARLAPQVLKGLTYFFDPAEILRPCFFQVFRIEERWYLYLLRVDLVMRAAESTVRERGTNDTTPWYTSRRLFLEDTVIPLAEVVREDGEGDVLPRERDDLADLDRRAGPGLLRAGDLDGYRPDQVLQPPLPAPEQEDLSLLSVPVQVQDCLPGLDQSFSAGPRKRHSLAPSRSCVPGPPYLDQIQEEMKNTPFSEEVPFFQALKAKVPADWYEAWSSLRVEAYLNAADMREYKIED